MDDAPAIAAEVVVVARKVRADRGEGLARGADVHRSFRVGAVGGDDILRAIDSGVSIYRALMAVFHETHRVVNPGMPVYHDAACDNPMADAKGVILESYGPDGLTRSLRIHPTTRTHFRAGTMVAWEWSAEHRFGEAWYRDADTNVPKYAWTSSMEFVGRNLDEL